MESDFVDLYSLIKLKPSNVHHPPFTTFKYRKKEGWVKRTIDYIFMQKNNFFKNHGLRVSSYSSTYHIEQDGRLNKEVGNPCQNHPSDHYSLYYEMALSFDNPHDK